MPPASPAAQPPHAVAAALEAFLAEHPAAILMEDGQILFDMRSARYSLATDHGRCVLHLWSDERNLIRRVVAATPHGSLLRLSTLRFGHTRPQTLELAADRDRRTPTVREATRTRFGKLLERALERHFPGWRPENFRTAMDLEKSFGPAYARGLLVQATSAFAVIGVNQDETQTTIDGILTLGLLWLHTCRLAAQGRRLIRGLRVIVPPGTGALTLSRMIWLHPKIAAWELWELDPRDESLHQLDLADHGNLHTHLRHAPNLQAARERFAASAASVMAQVPLHFHAQVDQRIRSATEMAFLLHGLEFARIRIGASPESFNRLEQITFGAGPNETPLTEENAPILRDMVQRLFERRSPAGDRRDILFRTQPERWLEGELRQALPLLDPSLDPHHVYSQVPAFAAADRGMMDILSVTRDGRLALLELKAEEDIHLPLQGLDYWIRVRWHHRQNPHPATGLGEFQRHGYFADVALSDLDPRLFLVAPALRIHPSTEIVLAHLSPAVDWTLIALDERWRHTIKVVSRKHSPTP